MSAETNEYYQIKTVTIVERYFDQEIVEKDFVLARVVTKKSRIEGK